MGVEIFQVIPEEAGGGARARNLSFGHGMFGVRRGTLMLKCRRLLSHLECLVLHGMQREAPDKRHVGIGGSREQYLRFKSDSGLVGPAPSPKHKD